MKPYKIRVPKGALFSILYFVFLVYFQTTTVADWISEKQINTSASAVCILYIQLTKLSMSSCEDSKYKGRGIGKGIYFYRLNTHLSTWAFTFPMWNPLTA